MSALFKGPVGKTRPASQMSKDDYLIDPARYPSEGNWAFCRFDSDEIPALRLGFQRGGFNGGLMDRAPSQEYLQLHLELMTRAGALLWIPSGIYPASGVVTDPHRMNITLDHGGRNIFTFSGWPTIQCHFCTEDGDLQAHLSFSLDSVTTLPDCGLPHCLFAMWESMGEASGSVRYQGKTTRVKGKVFFDHTRVIPQRHTDVPRHLYVYSTLYFTDGSGLFGYHSVDANGHPIDGYCFYIYVDKTGNGRFIADAALDRLELDGEGIAKSWRITCRAPQFSLAVDLAVQRTSILRCWGPRQAPSTRKEFSIIPLVLDGRLELTEGTQSRTLEAYGLAEYFNADLWPADMAANPAAVNQ